MKLPTGSTSNTATRQIWDATKNQYVTTTNHVDQSIMPGEDGFDLIA